MNNSSFWDNSKNIIYAVFIVLVIVLLFYCLYKLSDKYYSNMLLRYYRETTGEELDDNAKNALIYGNRLGNPNAMDMYRYGTVLLFNAHDQREARVQYNTVLDEIIHGNVETADAPFLLERIADFMNMAANETDVIDLPLQHALFAYAAQSAKEQPAFTKEVEKDDPEYTQKTILARQRWQSDNQNVHDSTMYKLFIEQYLDVLGSNRESGLTNIMVDKPLDWIKQNGKSNEVLIAMSHIKRNAVIDAEHNINELDVLLNVWRRAHDQRNVANKSAILEALLANIAGCVENGMVVCLTGRFQRVWQSLACLDFNPNIGVLKSKQSIRNEIYQRCAKIVEQALSKDNITAELKKAYENDENTEQVNELKETIKSQIDGVKKEYDGLVENTILNVVIDECKAAVV